MIVITRSVHLPPLPQQRFRPTVTLGSKRNFSPRSAASSLYENSRCAGSGIRRRDACRQRRTTFRLVPAANRTGPPGGGHCPRAGGQQAAVPVRGPDRPRAGVSCFHVRLPAHGNSDGRFTTFGCLEAEDVKTACDWVAARHPGQPIYALGYSMGGTAILRAAAPVAALRADRARRHVCRCRHGRAELGLARPRTAAHARLARGPFLGPRLHRDRPGRSLPGRECEAALWSSATADPRHGRHDHSLQRVPAVASMSPPTRSSGSSTASATFRPPNTPSTPSVSAASSPGARERRHGLEPLALPRAVERHAGQARVEGAVAGVLHDHDAVAPAVEPESERRLEPAGVAGVRVVDEDAVAVGDDPVRGEEEANGDDAAVGVAAGPARAPGRRA